ncbi:MAG: hypothetical protein R3F11_03180 [Verrucomicrobiales bacterium]
MDDLSGDGGNDLIIGGTGIGNTLSGGDGDDRIVGSDEGALDDPDFSDAVRFGDYIFGGAGNDEIFGLGGADYIDGGDDEDRIDSGIGADEVHGGAGNDWIFAGHGRGDLIRGGDDATKSMAPTMRRTTSTARRGTM